MGVASVLGGLTGAATSLIGGSKANDYLNEARNAYGAKAGAGIANLRQGRSEAQRNYAPFIAGGQSSFAKAQGLTDQRKQAAQPTYTGMTASSADPYLARMSDYGQKQSERAMQASALARGGMGGGFLKALSNNAQDYAATKYQAANQMAQDANAQNFGQEQQIYGNKTAFDQSQIANTQANAGMGLSGLAGYTGAAGNYDTGIANAFENWGTSDAGILGAKASNASQMWDNAGEGLTGAIAGGTTRKLKGW